MKKKKIHKHTIKLCITRKISTWHGTVTAAGVIVEGGTGVLMCNCGGCWFCCVCGGGGLWCSVTVTTGGTADDADVEDGWWVDEEEFVAVEDGGASASVTVVDEVTPSARPGSSFLASRVYSASAPTPLAAAAVAASLLLLVLLVNILPTERRFFHFCEPLDTDSCPCPCPTACLSNDAGNESIDAVLLGWFPMAVPYSSRRRDYKKNTVFKRNEREVKAKRTDWEWKGEREGESDDGGRRTRKGFVRYLRALFLRSKKCLPLAALCIVSEQPQRFSSLILHPFSLPTQKSQFACS